MKKLRFLLFPFAILYGIILKIRHFLYDNNIKKSKKYDLPILCVGNVSVGGTGKTPMIEYLIRLLYKKKKIAVLSRGYKRKTKGFVLADENSSAISLGDEPFQYYQKFENIQVAVCEQRAIGIENLLLQTNAPEVILLDDAFQHRKVQASANILLTVYYNLFIDDFLLPVGLLRDLKERAYKASYIVVTKCPTNISENDKQKIIKKLRPNKEQKIAFASIQYSEKVVSLQNEILLHDWINEPFTLVTGIANPQPMIDYLKEQKAIFEVLKYPDHHHFSESEIKNLLSKKRILTTEKDFVRLSSSIKDLFYLPIEMYFPDNTEKIEFENWISNQVK
ncbi:MAG: tetraacyldisaccharide 4'-kinase [Capnocytophaga sp.]|nr:tetraacyldisaccharide 4'-kinase [Capnocytophaga sp.]